MQRAEHNSSVLIECSKEAEDLTLVYRTRVYRVVCEVYLPEFQGRKSMIEHCTQPQVVVNRIVFILSVLQIQVTH